MSDKNTWISLVVRIKEFLQYLFLFFKKRHDGKYKVRRQKANDRIKKKYDKIDKRNQKKRESGLEKRLNNLF